jgi:hypothetical protein
MGTVPPLFMFNKSAYLPKQNLPNWKKEDITIWAKLNYLP